MVVKTFVACHKLVEISFVWFAVDQDGDGKHGIITTRFGLIRHALAGSASL
jgi:hypothetical protein